MDFGPKFQISREQFSTVEFSRFCSKIQEPGHAARSNRVEEPPPRVLMYDRELGSQTSLDKHLSKKHANLRMTPATNSNMDMYPHERDYVKSFFENPGLALTSKWLKNYKDPHNCDCAL